MCSLVSQCRNESNFNYSAHLMKEPNGTILSIWKNPSSFKPNKSKSAGEINVRLCQKSTLPSLSNQICRLINLEYLTY